MGQCLAHAEHAAISLFIHTPARGSESLSPDDLDVIFVDCDDTLYFNSWSTAVRLKNSISQFTSKRLGLDDDYAWRLYKQHGTALRGLLVESLIPPDRIEEYLHAVHNVPLDEISPNPDLRQMFLKSVCISLSIQTYEMRFLRRVKTTKY